MPSPSLRRAIVSGQKVDPMTRGSEIAILPFHLGSSRSLTLRISPSYTRSTLTKMPTARTSVNA